MKIRNAEQIHAIEDQSLGLCTIELEGDQDHSQFVIVDREKLEQGLAMLKLFDHRYNTIRVENDKVIFLYDNSLRPEDKIGVGVAPYVREH